MGTEMTAALISGGAGIALGLGLLIWALRERRHRHQAQLRARDAENARAAFERAAKDAAKHAADQQAIVQRLDQQLVTMRQRLEDARERLVACRDPETVRAWLDDELRAMEL